MYRYVSGWIFFSREIALMKQQNLINIEVKNHEETKMM